MNRHQKRMIRNGMIAGLVATTAVVGGVSAYTALNPERDVTFTVKSKERVCDSGKNGTCKYLIYTDKGTFENTDSLIKGKFNSSDMYGDINPGVKYDARVRGIRSGFFSMYPNIITIRNAK